MRFIGCKALLLDNIKSVIDENAPDAKSFCDIFSGTATVARYFKQWYEVTSNDLLYFSYVLQRGTVAVDCLPTYEILQENTGISDPVAYFNGLSLEQMERLPPERRFFQNTYAPIGGRMYINDENTPHICGAEVFMNIGKRLKAYREYHQLTQEDLATKAGVNEKYYGRIERNESCPTVDKLEKICTALGIELSELFLYHTRHDGRVFWLDQRIANATVRGLQNDIDIRRIFSLSQCAAFVKGDPLYGRFESRYADHRGGTFS